MRKWCIYLKKTCHSLYFGVQHSMCAIIIKTSDFVTAPSGIVFQNPLCCCGGGGGGGGWPLGTKPACIQHCNLHTAL